MRLQLRENGNSVSFVRQVLRFFRATWVCRFTLMVASVSVLAQTAQVDALLAGWNKTDSPGCALGVIRDGKLVYQRGYGMANLEHNVPLTSDTVFYIASTSKQFTAMGVALLVTQGRIALTDDIHKYVPELPRWEQPVTVAHLVHHTSGIPDFFALTPLAGRRLEDTMTDDDVLALLVRQPALNFKPGEQFQYSNSGYFLLGIIVSRITGKSLRTFAEESFFQPLGMRDTHFHDDRTMIVPKRATGYVPKAGGYGIFATLFDRVGDGGVMTTITDLVKWDQNFYDAKVGGQAMIDLALTPGTLNNGTKLDYAFGLFVRDYRGLKQISHGGIYNGFRADLIRFPAQKFSVACLCNLYNIDVSKLAQSVADIYLAGQYTKPELVEAPPAAITLPAAELQRRVGTYFAPENGATINLTFADGKLIAAILGGNSLNQQLAPLRANQFKGTNSLKSDFAFADATAQSALRMQLLPGIGQPTFTFVRAAVVTPDEKQLAEYAGRYYSAALDVTYEFTVKEGSLVLQFRNTPPKKLLPTVKDGFSSGGLNYVFTRDAQHHLNGFHLSDAVGRIRKIPFLRQ